MALLFRIFCVLFFCDYFKLAAPLPQYGHGMSLHVRRQVVQPKWLTTSDDFDAFNPDNGRVVVNSQKLQEAAAIRGSIQQAVAQGSYAVPAEGSLVKIPTRYSSSDTPTPPKFPPFFQPNSDYWSFFKFPPLDNTRLHFPALLGQAAPAPRILAQSGQKTGTACPQALQILSHRLDQPLQQEHHILPPFLSAAAAADQPQEQQYLAEPMQEEIPSGQQKQPQSISIEQSTQATLQQPSQFTQPQESLADLDHPLQQQPQLGQQQAQEQQNQEQQQQRRAHSPRQFADAQRMWLDLMNYYRALLATRATPQ